MSTTHIRHDQWRQAAEANKSSLPGRPSFSAVTGSFATLIDDLIAAQTQLIVSYLRIGSSVARPSRPAKPTATRQRPHPDDDQPALVGVTLDPAPAVPTDSIQARAYEIFVLRGRRPGDPNDDWRRAEAELRGEMTG
jgi:hypothetical protein